MITASLTRRKTQLELLATACQRRRIAQVHAPHADPQPAPVTTRFRGLTDTNVYLDLPSEGLPFGMNADSPVEVRFELDKEWFSFRTPGAGIRYWDEGPNEPVESWSLCLPICVQRRPARSRARISLDPALPVSVRFTDMINPGAAFEARLTNISGGGIGGLAPFAVAECAQPGQLYWTSFDLPDGLGPCELVVRLMHTREAARSGDVVLGCMFCPGDDPRMNDIQLQRIESFVASRRRAADDASATCRQGV